jgi:DNA-binding response OmpR family regulator
MKLRNESDVLIIDDDDAIRRMLCVALKRIALTCETAIDGADALEQMAETHYAVVLVDLMMPRLDGAGFVAALRERERASFDRPVVLLMTAFSTRETIKHLGDRVQAVIQKPFDVFELAGLVRDCVDGARLMDRA